MEGRRLIPQAFGELIPQTLPEKSGFPFRLDSHSRKAELPFYQLADPLHLRPPASRTGDPQAAAGHRAGLPWVPGSRVLLTPALFLPVGGARPPGASQGKVPGVEWIFFLSFTRQKMSFCPCTQYLVWLALHLAGNCFPAELWSLVSELLVLLLSNSDFI